MERAAVEIIRNVDSARNRRSAFGRLLADSLKVQRLKQEELARMLGTTQSSVSGWINGKYEPAAAMVFTIERSLGLDPGSLSRPLGYLPVEPVARSVSVEGAIAQNTQLDDDAKAALSALYRVLVRGTVSTAHPARPRGLASAQKRKSLPESARPGSVAGGR